MTVRREQVRQIGKDEMGKDDIFLCLLVLVVVVVLEDW